MSLGAAYWMLETKASLFELSEVFQFEKIIDKCQQGSRYRRHQWLPYMHIDE